MAFKGLSAPFWVHYSRHPARARLHHSSCTHCNNGTGMARRPAVPGGPAVWLSHLSLDDAVAFLRTLPCKDKAECQKCFAGGMP